MVMKHYPSSSITPLLAFILILHTSSSIARQISDMPSSNNGERARTMQMVGSRLPDCSHACGSCKPCKLVIVSFAWASLADAETYPISYRCMCNNKSYPVP